MAPSRVPAPVGVRIEPRASPPAPKVEAARVAPGEPAGWPRVPRKPSVREPARGAPPPAAARPGAPSERVGEEPKEPAREGEVPEGTLVAVREGETPEGPRCPP